MKSKQLAGCLFSALMLTCFQQGTAQTTYNGSVSKAQGQQMKTDQMGMAPKCDNQGCVDVWAEFLWWSTNFSSVPPGMSIMLDAITSELNNAGANLRIHTKAPSRHWDPGVRIGLGWNTGYDNWDVQGYWTYFYNSASKNEEPLEVDTPDELVGIDDGDAKLRMRYNAADAELGKAYYVSSHFFIRPFTGVHAIWLSQHHDEEYDVNGGFLDFSDTRDYEFESEQDLWGLGPRIGVNTNWGCFKGFSLMGNVSTSMLYGKALIKTKMDIEAGLELPETEVRIRQKEYWQIMPTLQLLLGISYGYCFNEGQNQFRISAGWETNFIWQASNFLALERPISMQGLTAQIRFDF